MVRDGWPETGWSDLLESTAALDGTAWRLWCDGRATRRVRSEVASGAMAEAGVEKVYLPTVLLRPVGAVAVAAVLPHGHEA